MSVQYSNAPLGFMRLPAILQVIPIGKSTWWAGVKCGKYPKPVKLGRRTTAWRTEDIQALVESLRNGSAESGNAGKYPGNASRVALNESGLRLPGLADGPESSSALDWVNRLGR